MQTTVRHIRMLKPYAVFTHEPEAFIIRDSFIKSFSFGAVVTWIASGNLLARSVTSAPSRHCCCRRSPSR